MTITNASETITNSVEPPLVNAEVALPLSPKGRLLVGFIEAVLIVVLAYFLVVILYGLFSPRPDFASSFNASSTQAIQNKGSRTLETIVQFDPFYREVVVGQQQAAAAPESSLEITIAGLRVGEDGAGVAIIDVQGDGQKLVALGDEITNGVTLSRIYPDRVEINRRGVRETVYMTKPLQAVGGAMKKTSVSSVLSTVSGSDTQFANIMKRIRLEPVRDDNNRRISGFIVTGETPQSLLASTGLEAGDIILAVNGSRLTSFERMQELSEELQSSANITIEIERRGQQLTLTY